MENMEFHIAVLSDEDGLYWSEIYWSDGEDAAEILRRATADSALGGSIVGKLTVHGPFIAGRDVAGEA